MICRDLPFYHEIRDDAGLEGFVVIVAEGTVGLVVTVNEGGLEFDGFAEGVGEFHAGGLKFVFAGDVLIIEPGEAVEGRGGEFVGRVPRVAEVCGIFVAFGRGWVGVEIEVGIGSDVGGVLRFVEEVLVSADVDAVVVVAGVATKECLRIDVFVFVAGKGDEFAELGEDLDDAKADFGGIEIESFGIVSVDVVFDVAVEEKIASDFWPPGDCGAGGPIPIVGFGEGGAGDVVRPEGAGL